MKIEIRQSGDSAPKCETCGSTALIYAPTLNAHLEVDLLAAFKESAPWYRPVKRAALKGAHKHVVKACEQLRESTIRA